MNSGVQKRNKNRTTIVSHSNTSNINSKPQNPRQNKTSNERTVTPEGVYCNGRIMHVTTSLVGCIVQIEVKDGTKYEGVLRTFSPDYELVVDYVAKLEPNNTQNANPSISQNVANLLSSLQANNSVSPTIIFKFVDIVKLTASNVDLDYATNKGQMLTDTEISKHDSRQHIDKELVPWEEGDNAEFDATYQLDDNGAATNGWAPEDMFDYNQRKFNVQTIYDSSLKDYTVPLVVGGENYEQKQAQAQKIADEIESDPKTSENLNRENTANDEETQFSAVFRPNDNVKHNRHTRDNTDRREHNRDRRNTNQSIYANNNASNPRPRSSQNSVSSPPFQSKPNSHTYNKHNSNNSSTSSYTTYNKNQSNQHQNYREESTELAKQYAGVVAANTYISPYSSKPDPDETPPNTGHSSHAHHSTHTAPPNQHPLPQRVDNRRGVQTNKRKEEVAESLKKFSVDFKLPSNVVESSSKENTKSDSNAKTNNNSSKNKTSSIECPPVKDKLEVNNDKELVENKVLESTASSVSSESELAKKSTLNPNAKTFTPRSPLAPVNTSSTPPSVASTPSSTVSSVQMAPQMPHHHQHHQQQQHQQQPRFQNPLVQLQTQYNVLHPGLTLPLGPNQYLMTNVAMTPTFTQQNANQQSRPFRNKGPQQFTNHGIRHEFAQPSHVAAQVTGHPVLATAPIAAPQQLPVSYATQQTTGMVTPPGPQAMYQHMYSGFHPRMNMLPPQTAMGMMQQAVHYADPNLQHIYTTAGAVQLQHLVSQAQAHQHMTNSGPHSAPTTPQSGTPTTPLHGAPAPSPVHHQPNQPPTPTPQQTVMYANVSSPHNPQSAAGVAHSNSGAYHHAQPQLVIIPSGQAVPGAHHSSGHGPLHAHALSHNATPGNHHGGPPQLMPLQLISNSAQGLTTFNPNPGV